MEIHTLETTRVTKITLVNRKGIKIYLRNKHLFAESTVKGFLQSIILPLASELDFDDFKEKIAKLDWQSTCRILPKNNNERGVLLVLAGAHIKETQCIALDALINREVLAHCVEWARIAIA